MLPYVSSCIRCVRLGIHNINSNILFNKFSRIYFVARCKSSNTAERIVVTDDGSVVVCWHPEKPFPYEFSKPIPEIVSQENSVLKIQNMSEVYSIFKPNKEEFVREELMKITYTTKHRWFPRSRDKYKKPLPLPDREYL